MAPWGRGGVHDYSVWHQEREVHGGVWHHEGKGHDTVWHHEGVGNETVRHHEKGHDSVWQHEGSFHPVYIFHSHSFKFIDRNILFSCE